jgi:hypothetical protein
MPDIEYHETIQYFSPKLSRSMRVTTPDIQITKLSRSMRMTTPDIQITTLSRTIQIQRA